MKRKAILMSMLFGFVLILTAPNSYAAPAGCTAITSLPYTITSSGSYCFTNDLSMSTTGTAITIESDHVVLDLAGFELQNTIPGNAFGVSTSGSHTNITVKNGRITGFGNKSIYLGQQILGGSIVSNSVIDSIITDAQIKVFGKRGIIRNCYISTMPSTAHYGTAIVAAGEGMKIINNDLFLNAPDPGIGFPISNGISVQGINPGDGGNVVENNRVSNTYLGIGISSENSFAVNNRISNSVTCLDMSFPTTGKYRDNLTTNCTTPYNINPGVVNAGNNN